MFARDDNDVDDKWHVMCVKVHAGHVDILIVRSVVRVSALVSKMRLDVFSTRINNLLNL